MTLAERKSLAALLPNFKAGTGCGHGPVQTDPNTTVGSSKETNLRAVYLTRSGGWDKTLAALAAFS
jgi:hypothetical protein